MGTDFFPDVQPKTVVTRGENMRNSTAVKKAIGNIKIYDQEQKSMGGQLHSWKRKTGDNSMTSCYDMCEYLFKRAASQPLPFKISIPYPCGRLTYAEN